MDNASLDIVPAASPARSRVRYGLGLFGLLVGIIGLALAVARPDIVETIEPPPPKQKLSDKLAEAGDKFVGRMIDRVKGRKAEQVPATPPATPIPWARYLTIAATSLGFVGAMSGTLGWVRREDHRLAIVAIIIGTLAVLWFHLLAALAMALAIMILVLLFSAFQGLTS